jgi:hypothetical protein
MRTLLWSILLLMFFTGESFSQSRFSVTGGGEIGLMNLGRLGSGYEQNMKSMRFIGDVAWRYNGANHLVFEGGYRYDSCAFVNNVEYLMPDKSAFGSYETNGMLKMKSALLGLAYRLAFKGKNFGMMIQTGAMGQYMFQASRFRLHDEKFEYRLYDEINPFNVLWRTKVGLRLSMFHVMVGYEMPFYDTIDHDEILSTLPGDQSNRSADLRGVRLDADAFFISIGVKLTLGEMYQTFNKLASGERIRTPKIGK